LIGTALKDFVPLDGARRTYEETKRVFELAGGTGRLGKVETDDEHKLNRELREACYGWMLQHLAGEEGDPSEPAMEVEIAETLRCTPTGCVMDIPGARSVFDINRDYSVELAQRRRGKTAHVGKILNVSSHRAQESGIELPSKLSGSGETLLMLVAPRRDPALAQQLTRAGFAVRELDLRGWGETTPDMPGRNAGFHWEDFFAWRAVELGRPLLAMRVTDLLTAVESQRGYKRIFVIGLDAGGVVALHAAALSDSITGGAAIHSTMSYHYVMQYPVSKEPVSSFVPGALMHYDLSDLAERIRPRRVVMSAEPAQAGRILKALELM